MTNTHAAAGTDMDEVADRLFGHGCDDALVGIGHPGALASRAGSEVARQREETTASALPSWSLRMFPISDLRQDAAGIIKRVVASDEPVFVTQRGRASVVIQSIHAYERVQHENEILKLLAQGDVDTAAGVGRDALLRKILASAMCASGFVNYPTEWSHWNYETDRRQLEWSQPGG